MPDDTTNAIYQAIWNTDYDTDLAANGRCGSHRLAEQIASALAAAGLLAAADQDHDKPAGRAESPQVTNLADEGSFADLTAIDVTVDREANAAYVRVTEGVVFRTAEINDSVNADYDRSAQLLGVEILGLPMAPAAPADDEASREALLAERAAWDQRLSDVQAEYLKREKSWDRTRERLTRERAELLWLHAEAMWQRDQTLPEWQCPGCGATTRARMADYPTERAAGAS